MTDAAEEPRLAPKSSDSSGRWARRIIMPLLILLVAGALWLWGTQREHEQSTRLEKDIRELCRQIHQSRDVDRVSVARRWSISPDLVDRLREIIPDSPVGMERIVIEVHLGDGPEPFGDSRATHHVLIRIGTRTRLGLRVIDDAAGEKTDIIGYWVP